MSISGTIIGRIVEIAKMKWDDMSEVDAQNFAQNIEDGDTASREVTYGSEIQAIKSMSQISELTEEQQTSLINDVYSKNAVSEELATTIRDKIDGENKYKNILKILSSIHDEWVRNNANKFGARPKDYQFVDLKLLPYREVESDLIFLQPILEGCGISVDNELLRDKFYEFQAQYLNDNGIKTNDDLIAKLKQGSKFYPALKNLGTNKGIENGESVSIDELIADDNVAKEMASQLLTPRTDLHSHLNAAISSEDLAKLAEELLGEKVDPNSLEITDSSTTYDTMSTVYKARKSIIDNFTKNGHGQEFIEAIAKGYKDRGIEYVELTTDSNILRKIKLHDLLEGKIEGQNLKNDIKNMSDEDEQDFINKVIEKCKSYGIIYKEDELKKYLNSDENDTGSTLKKKMINKLKSDSIDIQAIEKKYGVTMRFLLGLNRDGLSPENFSSREFQNLFDSNQYLTGIDIMGIEDHGNHELKGTNTLQFFKVFTYFAKQNPNFLIRIHGGERNGADENGIKNVLNAIKEEAECYGENWFPRIRIGHAIHAVHGDSDLIKLMKEMKVEGVELNLKSNLKLNNINNPTNLAVTETIHLCKKHGIPIFLGTDGYGIYQTSPKEQLILAEEAGVSYSQIIDNESNYLKSQKDKEQMLKKMPKDSKAQARQKIEFLLKLQGVNIVNIVKSQNDDKLKGKIPIIVAGGSFKTRGEGEFEEYKAIAEAMQVLAEVVDPGKCYIITGGTNCGPERFMHRAIQKRNEIELKKEEGKKLICLGAIPAYLGRNNDANASNDFKKIEPNTITDGIVLDDAYQGWGYFSTPLIKMSNNGEKNGFCIFIGGGATVRDEIAKAKNGDKDKGIVPVQSFCFNGFGFKSASKEALEVYKDSENIHGFTDTSTLINGILENYGKDVFREDFDIEKLPIYIEAAKERAMFEPDLIYNTLISEGKYDQATLDHLVSLIKRGVNKGKWKRFQKWMLNRKVDGDLNTFISETRERIKRRTNKNGK